MCCKFTILTFSEFLPWIPKISINFEANRILGTDLEC